MIRSLSTVRRVPVKMCQHEGEQRIVVEFVSSADVRRLEDRDEAVRAEVNQLRREVEGLRRSFYELLERFGDKRRP